MPVGKSPLLSPATGTKVFNRPGQDASRSAEVGVTLLGQEGHGIGDMADAGRTDDMT